ncbi:MAG: glycosyltransferase family 25 protein [Pseudomonadota bacterium]
MRTFIIHLTRATARRTHVEKLSGSAPYPAEVVEAVDGKAHGPTDRLKAKLYPPRYPFTLTPGEIGAFLSHRACWSRIVDQSLDYALILEDDVALDDGFADAVAFAAQHIANLGYVQFQTRPINGPYKAVQRDGDAAICRPQVVPVRLSAQLVSRHAAEKLLAMTETFDRPVDTFLQMRWETGQEIYVAQPSSVSDVAGNIGGSTISVRRSVLAKIPREIKRAIYRTRINAISRKDGR